MTKYGRQLRHSEVQFSKFGRNRKSKIQWVSFAFKFAIKSTITSNHSATFHIPKTTKQQSAGLFCQKRFLCRFLLWLANRGFNTGRSPHIGWRFTAIFSRRIGILFNGNDCCGRCICDGCSSDTKNFNVDGGGTATAGFGILTVINGDEIVDQIDGGGVCRHVQRGNSFAAGHLQL